MLDMEFITRFTDEYDRDTARSWLRARPDLPVDSVADALQKQLPGSAVGVQPVAGNLFYQEALEVRVATLNGAQAVAYVLFQENRPRLRIDTIKAADDSPAGTGSECTLGLIDFASQTLDANIVSLQAAHAGRRFWASNGFVMKPANYYSWRDGANVHHRQWLKFNPPESKKETLRAKKAEAVLAEAAPDQLEKLLKIDAACKTYGTLGNRLFMANFNYSARLPLDCPHRLAKARKKLQARTAGL